MKLKMLVLVLGVALMLGGLTGCSRTPAEFPISLTRQFDGVQISLGMTRDEIENILGEIYFLEYRFTTIPNADDIEEDITASFSSFTNLTNYMDTRNFHFSISVEYNDDGIATRVTGEGGWFLNDIAIGDNIQSIFDSGYFEHITHNDNPRDPRYPFVLALDCPRNPMYAITFSYPYGTEVIRSINLYYFLDMRN